MVIRELGGEAASGGGGDRSASGQKIRGKSEDGGGNKE